MSAPSRGKKANGVLAFLDQLKKTLPEQTTANITGILPEQATQQSIHI